MRLIERYVEQGQDRIMFLTLGGRQRFNPAGFRVNLDNKTCSCGKRNCEHLGNAIRAELLMPEADMSVSGEALDFLVDTLRGSTMEVPDHIAKAVGDHIKKCDRCEEWKPLADMSEDVWDVCLACVR